jgi:hypothetical protein
MIFSPRNFQEFYTISLVDKISNMTDRRLQNISTSYSPGHSQASIQHGNVGCSYVNTTDQIVWIQMSNLFQKLPARFSIAPRTKTGNLAEEQPAHHPDLQAKRVKRNTSLIDNISHVYRCFLKLALAKTWKSTSHEYSITARFLKDKLLLKNFSVL